MLEAIRQKFQGIVLWIIILVIGLAFVGLTDFFVSRGDHRIAVKVNGEKISWNTIEEVYHRMQRQYGDKVDAKTLKEQVRNALTQRAILLHSARKLGFHVGDNQIAETLLQIPVFKVDGKFSKERYLQVLRDAGYTDIGFRQELAQDILVGQLEQGLNQSSFSLATELNRLIELIEQSRDIGFVVLQQQKFKQGIQPSKEDIQAYFDKHQSSFVVPEQVALQYVQLSVEGLAKNITVENHEAEAYYQEHKASYGAPERAHARHILIAVPENASASEETKAKERIKEVQDKINAGADFESLAKDHSDDTESGKKGGDLGWFTKGQMVPEFEKAIFNPEKTNTTRGPIRTAFGYHFIQLIEHKPAETRPFKEVSSLVKEQIQREKAQSLFIEQGEELAKLAFEQSSSLSPIAESLGLKIQETEFFNRQGGKAKPTTSPEVIQAAFSDPILKQGNNSEPLKIGDGALVVVRLKAHQPAKQQTLQEVDKQIIERIVNERATTKTRELAESMIKRIRAGENPASVGKEKGLSWTTKKGVSRNNSEIDRNILNATFQASRPDENGKANIKAISLPNGDYLLLAINAVHDGDISKLDDNTRKSYRESLANTFGQQEFALYANRIVSQAKIEVSKPSE